MLSPMQRDSIADEIATHAGSGSRRRASRRHYHHPADIFLDHPDPSTYILGLPEARPRLGGWLTIAMLAGILMALALVFITSF